MKIIYEDLITAYKQIESGKKVLLAQASASPMFAAHQINAFGKSDALIAEVDYWASFPFNRIASLKADFNDVNKDEITSGQRYIWKKYSKEDTQSIVTHLSQFDEMTIADLLTFLVVEGQNNWLEGDYFRVNVINSGRTFLEDEFYVDLSRAVGYYNLTKLFFLKSCYDGDGLAALNKMVAQIKSLPTKGVGVRYLLSKSDDQEISQKIEPLKNYLVTPKVMMIQYYGVVDSAAATGIKPGGDKRVGNIHRISVEAQIQEGSLQIRWSYNKNIYTEKTMNQLVGFVDNLMCEISKRLESENSRAATAIAV